MNRQEKQSVITTLKDNFSKSTATFLVGVQGLTVVEMQGLRRSLLQEGGELKVAKNTLLTIAVDGIEGAQDLRPHFERQIAVVFAHEESPGVAKAIYEVAKKNDNLTIVAGCLDGEVIDVEKVKFLAQLPPREQLLAQVLGVFKSPFVVQATLMNAMFTRFLYMLKQAAEKQQ